MTDQEKLQKLFEAALKDSSELTKPPTRAFPNPVIAEAPSPPVPAPVVTQVGFQPAAVFVSQPQVEVAEAVPVTPAPQAGLDAATSTELGKLLDDQRSRLSRKRRRDTLVVLGVFLAMSGGGYGWFVQSPQRVQAFKDAVRDIRSVGDVATMVAKYRESLDRVAVRGKQIEQASAAMGVKASAADEADPYMEAEMAAMMGGEGKTVGQRNKALKENFGHMQEKNSQAAAKPESAAKMKEGEEFDWKK
jgi:hypothetical protein